MKDYKFLVELLDDANGFIGFGFLITADRVLTCAHVVNQALGRASETAESPDRERKISVRFPLHDRQTTTAKCIEWRSPTGEHGLEDCCVLGLTTPQPAIVPARLVEAKEHSPVKLFLPHDPQEPVPTVKACIGEETNGFFIVRSDDQHAIVVPGCSGGPVICLNSDQVMGMMVLGKSNAMQGYLLPTQSMRLTTTVAEAEKRQRREAAKETPSLQVQAQTVVPAGLKRFEDKDKDFFLELVPGHRRNGLPISIESWKRKIETRDPEDRPFRIGVLRGISGCGKSSLVRAGLVPCLASHIRKRIVESDGSDTESRLHLQLKSMNGLAGVGGTLSEKLRKLKEINQLKGHKTLIVLDQFEQWLHGKKSENRELADALLECDGINVQVLLLVREDFFTETRGFIRGLGLDWETEVCDEYCDPLGKTDAQLILAKLGAGYNRSGFDKLQHGLSIVPENDPRRLFLVKAVQGLSAGKDYILPVHLSTLAWLMRERDWHVENLPLDLRAVGADYLREIFETPGVLPAKTHSGCKAILRAFLPSPDVMIKMNTDIASLREAFGKSPDFEGVIYTLDKELRLITPVDAYSQETSMDNREPRNTNKAQFYTLTHDYLVESLRYWLSEGMPNSWHGKVTMRFQDSARKWLANEQDSRYLPSVLEHMIVEVAIRVRREHLARHERQMLTVSRRHSARIAGIGALFALLLILVQGVTLWRSHLRDTSDTVDRLTRDIETFSLQSIVNDHAQYKKLKGSFKAPLETLANNQGTLKERNARLAMLAFDPSQAKELARFLVNTPAEPENKIAWDDYKLILDQIRATIRDGDATSLVAEFERTSTTLEKGDWSEDNSGTAAFRTLVTRVAFSSQSVGNNTDELLLLALGLAQVHPDDSKIVQELLRPMKEKLSPILRQILTKDAIGGAPSIPIKVLPSWRSPAAYALVEYFRDRPEELCDGVCAAQASQFGIFLSALVALSPPDLKKAIEILQEKQVSNSQPVSNSSLTFEQELTEAGLQRARAAFALVRLGQLPNAKVILNDQPGVRDILRGKRKDQDVFSPIALSVKLDWSMQRQDAIRRSEHEYKDKLPDLHKLLAQEETAMRKMLDPEAQSQFIHRFADYGLTVNDIYELYNGLQSDDDDRRYALTLCAGKIVSQLDDKEKQKRLTEDLEKQYLANPSSAVHAAARWALVYGSAYTDARILELDEKILNDPQRRLDNEPQWFVQRNRDVLRTFVRVVPGDRTMVGTPRMAKFRLKEWNRDVELVKSLKPFYICQREVTTTEFDNYIAYLQNSEGKWEKMLYAEYKKMKANMRPNAPDAPVGNVGWFHAIHFCQWLTEDQDQWAYESEPKNMDELEKLKDDIYWNLNADHDRLAGFRIPNENEWEIGNRAGMGTSFGFGSDFSLTGNYAWFQENRLSSLISLVGCQKMPNHFGIFDMHGNMIEWCSNKGRNYQEPTKDDETRRIARGGGGDDSAHKCRCGWSGKWVATSNQGTFGFRLVCSKPAARD